jgi:segregation and condensation protein A
MNGERANMDRGEPLPAQDDYRVRLEVFEGPLDLLLYLIRREEVDIYDIPIERITSQYMETLDLMQMLDLSIAGEFLVMAATLMLIKSRMLLPVEDREELEEEDEDDPRWDLVRQLVAYKKFKDAAFHLQEREIDREGVFPREGVAFHLEDEPDIALQDVSLFDLMTAFSEALKRVREENLREIFAERFTVAEKIDDLLGRLKKSDSFSLRDCFLRMRSRQEIICTFLAVLELIRLRQVRVEQSANFSDILVRKTGDIEPGAEVELISHPEEAAP